MWILRLRYFRLILCFFLFSGGFLFSLFSVPFESNGWDDLLAEKIMVEINNLRQESNLPVLSFDPAAGKSARAYALELADRRVLSHRGLDGARVAQRYHQSTGTALRAGEILAVGDCLEDIFAAWRASPSHRDILWGKQWWRVAVAVYRLGGGRFITVAVFSNSRWLGALTRIAEDQLFFEGEYRHALDQKWRYLELLINGRSILLTELPGTGEGGSYLSFSLPLPPAWFQGKRAFLGFYIVEDNKRMQSDLLFLDPRGD